MDSPTRPLGLALPPRTARPPHDASPARSALPPSSEGIPQRDPACPPLHVAMVSTRTPRQCGIATFTQDLACAIKQADPGVQISWAAIDEEQATHAYGPEVRWRIRQQCADTYRQAARAISDSDVDLVSVQHEFGLYGLWGETFEDHLAPFLEALDKPLVVTFHTVLPDPSPSVLQAVRRIGERSQAVMAMAGRARSILEDTYGLDPAKLHVIPHGVPTMDGDGRETVKARLGLTGRQVISTFGFVDPRKGLEYMIDAMAEVVRDHPDALYVILGKTHPDLARRFGEQYRRTLTDLVHARGLQDHLLFVDEYLSQEKIRDYLVASDIYVTPYLDPNQITSGTLSYALGAGKAIVSTRYAHAVEALAAGRGLLVDFRSASALAAAVTRVLDSHHLRTTLERNAAGYGRHMTWPVVGRRVSRLYRSIALPAPAPRLLLARVG